MAGSAAIRTEFAAAAQQITGHKSNAQGQGANQKINVKAEAQQPRQDQALLEAMRREAAQQKSKPAKFHPPKTGGCFNLRSFIKECIEGKTPPIGVTAHCESLKDVPHIVLTIEAREVSTYKKGHSVLICSGAPTDICTHRFALTVEEMPDAETRVSIFGHRVFGKHVSFKAGEAAENQAQDEPQLLWNIILKPRESVRQPIGAFVDSIFKAFQSHRVELSSAQTDDAFDVALAALHNKRPVPTGRVIDFPPKAADVAP